MYAEQDAEEIMSKVHILSPHPMKCVNRVMSFLLRGNGSCKSGVGFEKGFSSMCILSEP